MPTFTQKHYIAIARAFAEYASQIETVERHTESERDATAVTIIEIVNLFADRFQADNPKFKRDKFLKASGL